MSTIYILKLKNNKYYVGRTDNIDKRYEKHLNGKGSKWTKKYKPIKILKIIKDCSSFNEDKYVKMYMSKYGIDNVRGGSYMSFKLNDNVKKLLQKEIWMANDVCIRCGRDNHFVRECYSKTTINGHDIDDECYDECYDDYLSPFEENDNGHDNEDDDGDDEDESSSSKDENIKNDNYYKTIMMKNTPPPDIHFNEIIENDTIKNYDNEFTKYNLNSLIEIKNTLIKLQKELVLKIGDIKCIYTCQSFHPDLGFKSMIECTNKNCMMCGNEYDYLYKFNMRFDIYENIITKNVNKLHLDKEIQNNILEKIKNEKIHKKEVILLYLEELPEFIKNVLLKTNTITIICNEIDKEIDNRYNNFNY